jgi:hypothetical protein
MITILSKYTYRYLQTIICVHLHVIIYENNYDRYMGYTYTYHLWTRFINWQPKTEIRTSIW